MIRKSVKTTDLKKKSESDELILTLFFFQFVFNFKHYIFFSILFLHSLSKQNKRIFYTILELSPLLDSSNMTPDDWAKIAKKLEVWDINSFFT